MTIGSLSDERAKAKAEALAEATAAFPVQADAAMVRRAAAFASNTGFRRYLMGVCIRPSKAGGVLVIGTDGHALLCLHDPQGRAPKDTIVPFGPKDATKIAGRALHVRVSAAGEVAVYDVAGNKTHVASRGVVDASYPVVDTLVKPLDQYRPGLPGTFDPALLSRALGASKGQSGANTIRFHTHKNERDAALFAVPDGFGLVMPMIDGAALEHHITTDFGGSINGAQR